MKNSLIAVFLITLGTFKACADLLDNHWLSGLGAVTNASPAMKVFTAQQGFETYSSRFFIDFTWSDGNQHSIELTPALYQQIRGPYNRRNVYGAALSYGPVLVTNEQTRALFSSVSQYAFCQPGIMLDELGLRRVSAKLLNAQVRLQVRGIPPPARFPTILEVRCD